MADTNMKTSFKQTQMKFYCKPDAVAIDVTAVSNAAPAVLDTADQTIKSGDVVYLQSDNPAANGLYMVEVKTKGKITLLESDFTAIGAVANAKDSSLGVRLRVIRSVVERETAQTTS